MIFNNQRNITRTEHTTHAYYYIPHFFAKNIFHLIEKYVIFVLYIIDDVVLFL
jgi:hypothetical protein